MAPEEYFERVTGMTTVEMLSVKKPMSSRDRHTPQRLEDLPLLLRHSTANLRQPQEILGTSHADRSGQVILACNNVVLAKHSKCNSPISENSHPLVRYIWVVIKIPAHEIRGAVSL